MKTEPAGPVRSRNLNAGWDNTRFQHPRLNAPHDQFRPKHVPNWVRFQEATFPNFEPKPFPRANVPQKMTMLNKEINAYGHKVAAKQDFVYPTQKSFLSAKKMAAQKKLAMQIANITQKYKTAAHLANVEETLMPKMKRVPKILNTQPNTVIQKTKGQEVIAAPNTKVQCVTEAQKPKMPAIPDAQVSKAPVVTAAQVTKAPAVTAAQNTTVKEVTAAQISKPQEVTTANNTTAQEIAAAQKIKQDNEIAVAKNVAKQDVNTTTMKTQNNSLESTKPHENGTAKTKSAQELSAQQTKPETGECKSQDSEATEKLGSQQSNTVAPSKQQRELDATLAQAVEDELQDIMIQVRQELPDEPEDDVDCVVVEKLRNEVGYDLRRVFGLNITKRLLNVYSNLFLKIKFTCRPQMGCLTNFLNEYKIGKFKRIDKNSNTFAAEMDTIEDFDKLCAVKELICGEAKVTVIPCYKFTHCPENLKTIYDDTYFYDDHIQDHTASTESEGEAQAGKVIESNENENTKPAKEPVNAANKSILQTPHTSTTKETAETATKTTTSEAKPDTEKAKSVASNDNIIKSVTKTENKEKFNNPDNLEVKKTEMPVHNDSEDVKKDTANNSEKIIDSKKIINKNCKLEEKALTDKVPMEKKISIEIGKGDDICEYVIKDILGSDEDDDDFDADVDVPENQMDGDEELNDEDILALMSEGVVVDECSGSEDEK